MVLKEQELLQIDEQFLHRLQEQDPDALVGLSIKLTSDLKEALERLNQNPSNSSKPSGSLAPWDKGTADDDDDEELNIDEKDVLRSEMDIDEEEPSDIADTTAQENSPQSKQVKKQRKPGRQLGSQGFGRTQKLEVTDTIHHPCGCCSVCNEDLTTVEKAYTGFQTVNIEFGSADSPGMQLSNTQHLYYAGLCSNCGLENRSEPWRGTCRHIGLEKCGHDRMAADRPRFGCTDCLSINGYANHPPQSEAILVGCVWSGTGCWHYTELHSRIGTRT